MSIYRFIKLFRERTGNNNAIGGDSIEIQEITQAIGNAIPGPYSGHTEAASNGVELNGLYRLKQVNDFDIKSPGGMTIVMRVTAILLLILSSISLQAQFITNELISELNTMQQDDPGDFKSPWRYSRTDSTLYRWNYTTSQWEEFSVRLDYGNILFVGENGDDDSAVKGSPIKYWATIDSALTNASEGDLIYHFTRDSQAINVTSQPWVSIVSKGKITNATNGAFSSMPSSGTYIFEFNEYIGPRLYNDFGQVIDTTTVSVTCNKCLTNPILPRARNFVGKYNTMNGSYTGGKSFHTFVDGGDRSSIWIGNYVNKNYTSATIPFPTDFASNANINDSLASTSIEIDNLVVELNGPNIGAINVSWGTSVAGYDGKLNFKINSGYWHNPLTYRDSLPYTQYASDAGTVTNGFANWKPVSLHDNILQVRNFVCDAPILAGAYSDRIDISGRWRRTRALEFDSSEPISRNFIGNLDVTCDSSHVVSVLANPSGSITLSGIMRTGMDSTAVIHMKSGSTIYLKDAQLYNDGTVPCIQADGAVTAYVVGDLYMSADTLDSDVTFVDLNWSGKDYNVSANILNEENSNVALGKLNTFLPVDVSTGIVEVDLPAGTPSKGNWFVVSDSRGNAGTNNITVDFINSGDNFLGATANDVITTDGATVEYIYIDSTIGWIKK